MFYYTVICVYFEVALLCFFSDFRRHYGLLNFFIKSNSQKSEGAKSGKYGGWRIIVIPARSRQPVTF